MARDTTVRLGEHELRGVSKDVARHIEALGLVPDLAASGRSGGESMTALLVAADRVVLVRADGATSASYDDVRGVGEDGVRLEFGTLPFRAYSAVDQRTLLGLVAERAGLHPRAHGLEDRDIPAVTTPTVPGYEVVEALGTVTGVSVAFHGFLTGLGFDAGPMERELRARLDEAREDARRQAVRLGADALVSVTAGVTGFGDKAQGGIACGTAVRLRPVAAQQIPQHPAPQDRPV